MDPENAHATLSPAHTRSLLSPSVAFSVTESNWRLKFLWDQKPLEMLDLLVLTLGAWKHMPKSCQVRWYLGSRILMAPVSRGVITLWIIGASGIRSLSMPLFCI